MWLKLFYKIIIVVLIFVLIFIISQYFGIQVVKSIDSNNEIDNQLTKEELKLIKDKYISLLDQMNPREVLSLIREDLKKDSKISRYCHGIVHEVGHESFEKYGSFGEAMKYQDELCNSGYLHGIIESSFSDSAEVLSLVNSICDRFEEGKYNSWECYHGIGHGLMFFTENDLNKSLNYCNNIKSKFGLDACVNGVFMENFNTDQNVHVSKFVDSNNWLYPCGSIEGIHKGDCYFYSPTFYLSLNKNKYKESLDLCLKAEGDYIASCVAGVGSQVMKENINDIKYSEKICKLAKRKFVPSCVYGMTSFYIFNFGSLESAGELCKKLSISNRSFCYNAVADNTSMF